MFTLSDLVNQDIKKNDNIKASLEGSENIWSNFFYEAKIL